MTYTFAELEVSAAAYDEITEKLRASGYDHAFVDGTIDMRGIGLTREAPKTAGEKSCGTCNWFDPDFAPDDDPAEHIGLCTWPADNLPHSLRYGNRERMAVRKTEGQDCSCHVPVQSSANAKET